VALATKRLYEMGLGLRRGDQLDFRRALLAAPAQLHRSPDPAGDQAFFDVIQSFMGYRTCYYRTFNVGRATSPQRTAYKKAENGWTRAIELLKPGMASRQDRARLPRGEEIGFASRDGMLSGSTSATALASGCTNGR